MEWVQVIFAEEKAWKLAGKIRAAIQNISKIASWEIIAEKKYKTDKYKSKKESNIL